METLTLSDFGGGADYLDPLKKPEGPRASDYGRAALAGLYGIPGGVASGLDYLFDTDEGSSLKAVREWADQGSASAIQGMSDSGREALSAGVLPGEGSMYSRENFGVASSLGLKVANAAPSLLATILPGGIIGAATRSALAGTAAAGSVNAAMMGGQVFDDIEKEIGKAKDEELRRDSPFYAKLREDGADEAQAKRVLVEYAAGNKPAIMGLVGALAEHIGAGGIVARAAAGAGRSGVLRAARNEGLSEGAQNATQEGLTQTAGLQAGTQEDYDLRKAAEQTAQGAVIGGILGGAVGAATRTRAPKATPGVTTVEDGAAPPAEAEALRVEQPTPVDQPVPIAPKAERLKAKNRKAVQTPAVDPAAEAALTTEAPVEAAPVSVDPPVPDVAGPAPVVEQPIEQPVTEPEPFLAESEFEADPDAVTTEVSPELAVMEAAPEAAPPASDVAPTQAPAATELPEVPAEPPAAGGLSEAPQTTGPQTLILSEQADLPPMPREPTPLVLQTPEERAARKPTPAVQPAPAAPPSNARLSKKEAARIAKGEGDAVIMPDPAQVAAFSPNQQQADRRRAFVLAEAQVAENGEAAPQWAKDILSAKGKMRGQGPSAVAAREAYARGRQALSDLTNERIASGAARRETSVEAAQRQRVERQERHAAVVEEFLSSNPLPETALRNPRTLREYAAKVLAAAKRAKVEIPRQSTDAHMLYLKNAQAVTAEGAGRIAREQFLADDFLLRNGAGEELAARRDVEAVKAEQSYDENGPRTADVREGADAAELYEAEGAVAEAAAEETSPEKTDRDNAREPEAAPAPAPERAADTGPAVDAVVAGADRAGTFVAERRGQRRRLVNRDTPAAPIKLAPRRVTTAVTPEALRSRAMEATPPRRREPAETLPLSSPYMREGVDLAMLTSSPLTASLDYDLNDGQNRIVNPRTGVAVVPLETATLAEAIRDNPMDRGPGVEGRITPFMTERLIELVPDIRVHVISSYDMDAMTTELRTQPGFGLPPKGYYEPSQRTIILDESSIADDAALSYLLAHEGMHAAFYDVIERRPEAKQLINQMIDHVRAATGKTAREVYGLTNAHEFISEAFSNGAFQELLMSVPAPQALRGGAFGPTPSVWALFLSKLRQWLGLPRGHETMLDSTIRVGAVLTQLRSTLDSVPSTPRAMPAASQRVNEIARAVENNSADLKSVATGSLRRTAMRLQTFQQLEEQWGYLFDGASANPVTTVVRGVQRMGPFARKSRETAETFAARYAELHRTDRALAEKTAELRNDVTMANVNLLLGKPTLAELRAVNGHIMGKDDKSDIANGWQSKAQILELQKRFSSLPEAQQRQLLEEAKFYRDMQNKITHKLIENILDTMAVQLQGTQRQEIVSRTMAGTLTEDDAKLIDNSTVFTALQGAKALRAIKGMYFPLMRHGDYVVRTTDAITDTMGGEEVEPGVVEFRAGKDKEARALAKKFAEGSPLTVTRVAKTYYDPQTGERLKAADADAGSIVGYRVHVQKEGVHFFDTKRAAARFVREARANREHTQVSDWQVRQDIESKGDLTGSQLSALVKSIEARSDVPEGQRKIMQTAIKQAAVRLMSGNRIQQRSLPRRRVQGASQEYARNALRYGTAASNYLAKLEFMPTIRGAMEEMRDTVRDRYHPLAQDRQHLFDEITKRIDHNVTDVGQPSRAVQLLLQVTMLSKLASPAYSIINAMQPLMVTYPVLASEHGQLSAGVALEQAYRNLGFVRAFGSGVRNTGRAARQWARTTLDTTDVLGNIRSNLARQEDGAQLNKMLDELTQRGALDDGAAFELAGAIAGGAGTVTTVVSKVDRVFRQLPVAVEYVNRTATAVAAYRLARAKGLEPQAARDYAYDMTVRTQGDYSPSNAPPIFNKPGARLFLQFKKYGQMMTHLWMDMVYRAFRNAKPGDRREALRLAGNLFAVQMVFAGALGLPGLELAKIGFTLASLLGVGGGWDDQERRIKRLLDEYAGKDASEYIRKGLSRAAGIDLSGRTSLSDMWVHGEPKDNSKSEVLAWIATQVGGAALGTVSDARDGAIALQDGDWETALAKMFPVKVVSDLAKAGKGWADGRMSGADAFARGAGFTTARQANRAEERSERIAKARASKEQRDRLRRAYLNARSAGDRAKVISRIRDFNRTANFRERLNPKSLEKMRQRDLQEALR